MQAAQTEPLSSKIEPQLSQIFPNGQVAVVSGGMRTGTSNHREHKYPPLAGKNQWDQKSHPRDKTAIQLPNIKVGSW